MDKPAETKCQPMKWLCLKKLQPDLFCLEVCSILKILFFSGLLAYDFECLQQLAFVNDFDKVDAGRQ